MFLLKKKDEDLFSGISRPKQRRSKKDKRRLPQVVFAAMLQVGKMACELSTRPLA